MNNKTALVLAALLFLCGITTLNLVQKAEGKTAKKAEARTFTGRVDAVSLADPAKGTKSEVVLIDTNKKKLSFLITSITTMYGVKSVPITLDKIKKGDKVKVKYTTTKEGVNEAISVRITL